MNPDFHPYYCHSEMAHANCTQPFKSNNFRKGKHDNLACGKKKKLIGP